MIRPFVLFLSALFSVSVVAQGTHQWTQARFEEFQKGAPKSVTIRSDGRLEAGPELKAIFTTPSTYVWSVASDSSGNAYLATGSPAAVLKVTADGKSTTLFETRDLAVQTVRVAANDSGDVIYASTLPAGKVYRFKTGATDSAKPLNDDTAELIFDPAKTDEKPKYIWDMTFDSKGRLYLASGGPAAIYRYDSKHSASKPELFFKSDEQHIRCLAFDPEGNLIAGTDGSGLVYKIDSSGKGYVLFEASRREITALAISSSGAIYVAAVGDKTHSSLPPLPVQGITSVTATITIVQPGSIQAFNGNTVVPDGTEIFEIPADSAPRKLWSNHDEIIYALRSTPHGLIAAGGNRGHIFRIGESSEYADIGHLEAAQGVAFADAPGKGLFIGTSNTGKLYRLGMEPAAEGNYFSDVFDASVYARWGRVEVDEINAPKPSSFELFARSGNVENPERGWSDWFQLAPNGPAVGPPAARYTQWKATLRAGASIGAVTLNYLPVNVVPIIDEVVVAVGARVTNPPAQPTPATVNITFPSVQVNTINFQQDSTTGPLAAVKDRAAITARWNAHDDNGDELAFDVYFRGDGEQDWHLLKRALSERYYSFDSALLPDGGYRIKIVASDSPSHNLGEALTAQRESDRFVVDTTAPVITALKGTLSNGKLRVTFDAADATSSIARAEYAVDAGRWQYVEPADKLSDSFTEHYDFLAVLPVNEIPAAKAPSEHLITVRVYDRHDNVSTAKTVVK